MGLNAVTISMFFVIFNLSMSWVVQADIFGTGNTYYESDVTRYAHNLTNASSSDNILSHLPVVNAIPQAQTMFNSLAGLLKCLSFDWVKALLPMQLRADALTLSIINGFNAIFVLLVMYAVVGILSSAIGKIV